MGKGLKVPVGPHKVREAYRERQKKRDKEKTDWCNLITTLGNKFIDSNHFSIDTKFTHLLTSTSLCFL